MSTITLNSIFAPAPNTERGKPTRLTHSPNYEEVVYGSGNTCVCRKITDPMVVDLYTGHKAKCTVARYAPSGYYCASADIQGNVHIWDTVNKAEHIVKYQKQCFSAGVLDLDWSEDSKRILVVGNGKDTKAEVWMWDSGTSVGDITGHLSNVIGCSYRKTRPYRIATCGEDNLVNFYKGPPFRFDHSNREHTRFVNSVEYSPDGSIFATGGGDKKIYLFDGAAGTMKSAIGVGEEHKLSVYSVTFDREGKTLFSCSADKTCKLWDVETTKLIHTYSVRETPDLYDTPVGCTFTVAGFVAATLRGDLVVFDPRVADTLAPVMTLRGHNKPIQSLHIVTHEAEAATEEEKQERARGVNFVTSSYDGQLIEFNKEKGAFAGTGGYPHNAQSLVSAVTANGVSVSVGTDANISFQPSLPSVTPTTFPTKPVVKSFGIPKGVALLRGGKVAIVAGLKKLSAWRCSAAEAELAAPLVEIELPFEVTSITGHVNGNVVVVGGADQHVHLFRLSEDEKTLQEFGKSKGKYPGAVSAVAISSDGKSFAASRDRFVCIGTIPTEGEITLDETRLLHTSRVTALDFSPDGKNLLTGGLDCQVFVWDVSDTEKFIKLPACHSPLGITGAKWFDNNEFITTGSDGIVRTWKI